MNQLIILLKREYWEHRGSFLILPAAVMALFIVLISGLSIGITTGALEVGAGFDEEENGVNLTVNSDDGAFLEALKPRVESFSRALDTEREKLFDKIFGASAGVFSVILWVVMVGYFLSALHSERKDRSVLFWKSMPVSDSVTVISKLLAGLFLAPLIFLACLAVGQVVMLLCMTMIVSSFDINLWSTLWVPANLGTRWLMFGYFILIDAMWSLPFFGWLLLVSSWAKSNLWAWALGGPILIAVLETLFLDADVASEFMMRHIVLPIDDGEFTVAHISSLALSIDMLVAIVLGAAFITGAVLIRSKSNEI